MITQAPVPPVLWPLELSAILRLGYRQTSDEVLAEALGYLLQAQPDLRHLVAVELYRQEQITLSRAVEIASLPRPDFQALLRQHGVLQLNDVEPVGELEAGLESYRQWQAAHV